MLLLIIILFWIKSLREYIVTKEIGGKKIFRFLHEKLPEIKNGDIFKLLRKGIVKVNNKLVESNYEIKENDKIIIYLNEEHFNKNKKSETNKFHSIKIDLSIIFEDKDIIVINKKRGVLTHPDKRDYKNSLLEQVKAYLFKKNEFDPSKSLFIPTPCHRLDRNTSGIIIFAKNHNTLKKINEYFKQNEADKRYLAIIYGKIDKDMMLVSKKMKNIENSKNIVSVEGFAIKNEIKEKKSYLKENYEDLVTIVKPISYNKNITYTEIELWTGKKHQIRVHLMMALHPLIGDQKYYTKESYLFSKNINIKSYFLHSYKLKIPDYDEFIAPIPFNNAKCKMQNAKWFYKFGV